METNNLEIEFLDSSYDKPVQLIYFDDQRCNLILINSKINKLSFFNYFHILEMKVGKDAQEFIKDMITQCREFGVISIVGNYRTGKSYFINQILLNRPKAFTVGSTVNACTRVKIPKKFHFPLKL